MRPKSKAVGSLLLAKFQNRVLVKVITDILITVNYRAIHATQPGFIEVSRKRGEENEQTDYFVDSTKHQSRIDPCSLIMHNWYYGLSYVDIREHYFPTDMQTDLMSVKATVNLRLLVYHLSCTLLLSLFWCNVIIVFYTSFISNGLPYANTKINLSNSCWIF